MLSQYYPAYPVTCYSIDNVLTKEECEAWIADAEAVGFEPAAINVGGKQVVDVEQRLCERCYLDDPEKTNLLWDRLKLPTEDPVYGKLMGLNPRLRCLRYSPGHYFRPHYDGKYDGIEGQISYWTVQLYLNDDFVDGNTIFHVKGDKVKYKPKQGSVLIFDQELRHEGETLGQGNRKYTIRTDVMFLDDDVMC